MGKFATRYCSEWDNPSVHVLLFVEFLVFCFFVVIVCVLTTLPAFDDWLRLNNITSSSDLALVFVWFWGLTVLVTVYAPYQQQMVPSWFKIASFILYGGYILIVVLFWFVDAFRFQNISNWDEYSLLYAMNGVVLVWILPYVTGGLYVLIGWQLVEYYLRMTWTGYQTLHLLVGLMLLTVIFFLWYFIGKYNGKIKKFPAISSAIMFVETRNERINLKKWCCQDCLFEGWTSHCFWWMKSISRCNCCTQCYKHTMENVSGLILFFYFVCIFLFCLLLFVIVIVVCYTKGRIQCTNWNRNSKLQRW